MDPYKTLGLEPLTDIAVVKKAYRQLAKTYHPDHNKDPKATEMFRTVTAAYDIIVEGKYSPEQYRPKTHTPPPSSEDLRFHVTTKMSSSFTGATINDLPGGPFFLKPGFIAEETWTIIRPSFHGKLYLTIHYRPQEGFTHIDHDLYTTMTVSKKDLKRNLAFDVPNHPNKNWAKIRFPKNITNRQEVTVEGQGLPDDKGSYGDLYITVKITDTLLINPSYIALLVWGFFLLFFLCVAFSKK